MKAIIVIAKAVLDLIYMLFRLFRTKDKITFLSRQSNVPSIDFKMLSEELKKQNPNVKIVMLTKKIEGGIKNKLSYGFHIFTQMYHVATSKVVIIDGYQIVISVLKHKKKLKVIQIWHALGSLKKFGYSILDKGEGSKKTVADNMNMHKNYDAIGSSSKIAKKNCAEAFNTDESKVLVMGLPRVDFLSKATYKTQTIEKIKKEYPALDNNKKNILYVPTFRKNSEVNVVNIIDNVDYSKFNLIIKLHSGGEQIRIDNKDNILEGNVASGMEFIHIADYVITDYSAISFEAAIADKPLYYYVYDYTEYKEKRDMYLDFEKEMPGVISEDAREIISAIEKDVNDVNKRREFVKKHIETYDKNNTEILAKYILELGISI